MKLDITFILPLFFSKVISWQTKTLTPSERWSPMEGIEFQMTVFYKNQTDGNSTLPDTYLNLTATIPSDTFFAVGFGENLYSTDVIMFRAFTSLDTLEIRDMHFSRDRPPVVD